MRLLAVCGSLKARSSNLTLLRAAQTAAPDGVEVVLTDLLRQLPPFDPDLEEPPRGRLPVVEEWRRAISDSDALLIACPEYGMSLPGSLKNGIDWVIGTAELERKIVGTAAAVPGLERGRMGLRALHDTLGAVSATIVGGVPILQGPSLVAEAQQWVLAVVCAVKERSEE